MRALWKDLRSGLRLFRTHRLLASVSVLTLAVAIGTNCAIFAIVDAVLLRPLPFEAPERLLFLRQASPGAGDIAVSYPDFLDWRQQSRTLSPLAAFRYESFNLAGTGRPDRLSGAMVSAEIFPLLGQGAVLGRTLQPGDDRPEADPVAVLGYDLWRTRFGGDPAILGRPVSLNGRSFLVVGVMPDRFRTPLSEEADLWVPIGLWGAEELLQDRGNRPGLYVLGRLRPGVALEQAREEFTALSQRLAERYPETNRDTAAALTPLRDETLGSLTSALRLLLGAGALLLLIACANVASLLISLGLSRQRELALRAILGAGRSRLVRQLLTESLLIAGLGGALGLLLAFWGLGVLRPWLPPDLPRIAEVSLDVRVFAFAAVVALAAALLAGLAPALRLARNDLAGGLREDGPGATQGRAGARLQGLLVAGEVALALALLVGSALLAGSYLRLAGKSPGLDPEGVMTARIDLPDEPYRKRSLRRDFFRQVLARVESLSGVRSAALVQPLPLSGTSWTTGFVVEGQAADPDRPQQDVEIARVSHGYFRIVGIGARRGRLFAPTDTEDSPPVAIVDETLAARFWPGQNPVGKRLKLDNNPESQKPWLEVVGVVGHVKNRGVAEESIVQVYVPFWQNPSDEAALVLRADGRPESLANPIRDAVAAIDPGQPVYAPRPLAEYHAETAAASRLSMLLLAIFAGVALALAMAGIYALASFQVRRRLPELGLRMTFGAAPRQVRLLVVVRIMRLVGLGVLAGLALAAVLARGIAALLFELNARDPRFFLGVAALLVVTALAATYLPARRAGRVDPLEALRLR